MVSALQQRLIVNRAQDLTIESSWTLDTDSRATVAALRDALSEIADHAGNADADSSSSLFNVDDLRLVSRPRWADQCVPQSRLLGYLSLESADLCARRRRAGGLTRGSHQIVVAQSVEDYARESSLERS